MMKLHELDEMVQGVCPIHGLNSRGVISFKDEATAKQQKAAQDMVDEFLPQTEEFAEQKKIDDHIASIEAQQHPDAPTDPIDEPLEANYSPEPEFENPDGKDDVDDINAADIEQPLISEE